MNNKQFYFISNSKHKFANNELFVGGHAIDQMIERKGIYTQARFERILNESIEFDANVHYQLEVFGQQMSHEDQRFFYNVEEGVLIAVMYNRNYGQEAVATVMALCQSESEYTKKNDGKYMRPMFHMSNRQIVDKYFIKHKSMNFNSYVRKMSILNPFQKF